MSEGISKFLAVIVLGLCGVAVLGLVVTIAGFFFDLRLPSLVRM